MAGGKITYREVSVSELERPAHIIGPSGASHQALSELLARRGNGEDVFCYHTSTGTFLVGPRLVVVSPTSGEG